GYESRSHRCRVARPIGGSATLPNKLFTAVIAVAATLGFATALATTTAPPVVRVRPMLGPRVHVSPTRQPPTTDECERASGIACYSPDQIRQAYDLNALYARQQDGTGRTIAVIDPFGSPSIRSDLEAFD